MLLLLSARRVVENAFGQLVGRFRIFLRIFCMEHHKAVALIHSAIILHNFLGMRNTARLFLTSGSDK